MKNCKPKGSKFWWFWMFFEFSFIDDLVKTREIKIHYPCWLARRLGAVATVYGTGIGYIRMRDNVSRIFRKMLLRHEIGHILGFTHCWYPECMNPTRIFRWFVRKSLRGKIEIVD